MPRTSPVPRRPRRLPAEERKQEIIDAAFHLLATKGFEGLRMRDVATHVGINSATIHHYFPTKQNLIESVAEHLATQFATVRAPAIGRRADVPGPLHALRQEFADARFYRTHHPELLAASRELSLHATRDPSVAAVVAPLNRQWTRAVERILETGKQQRVFRGNVIPSSASAVIVAALWGMSTLLQLSDREFAKSCQSIELFVRAN
jgi:AcrR family transcriptional regulator